MKDRWPDTLQGAKSLQEYLRRKVKIVPLGKVPETIAGVDATFAGDLVIAVASLYRYSPLEHEEDTVCRGGTRFPYVPGYLAFREGHTVVDALKRLKTSPDVILVDGQGIAHPRGIGIASHIGILLGIPTIGCAKSRLIGEFREPGTKKGDWTYLVHEGRKVGAVLRTRWNVKPIFVSPGHLIDIQSAVAVVMHCVSSFRVPDPLRQADHVSRERRQALRL